MKLLLEDWGTGKVLDLTPATERTTWETSRRPAAGRVEFAYHGTPYPEGSLVQLSDGGSALFQGRLFKSSQSRDGSVQAMAYDQLRYLKTSDAIIRRDMTLADLVRLACSTFGLRMGTVDDTQLKLPGKVYDNKEWLSSLEDSIRENNYLNGWLYCLYDSAGAVCLRELEGLKLPLQLGDGSLVYDWQRERSIEEAANCIKLLDATNGGVYQYQDGDTIAAWGTLQQFEKLSGYNTAQMDQLGKALLAVKNRVTQTLTVSALGDGRVRGGSGVKMVVSALGINEWMVVEKAVHTWQGRQHTMKLELGVRG